MPQASTSNPPIDSLTRESYIAWVARHNDEVIGVGRSGPQLILGPLANFFRDLGFSEIIISREDVLGVYRGVFVDLFPIPGWIHKAIAAEELFREEVRADELLKMLDKLGV